MKQSLRYVGLLAVAAGAALLFISGQPPNLDENARKAGAAVARMNETSDVEEAGRLRLEAAGLIEETLAWKRSRRDAGFGLLGLGVALLAAYASVRRKGPSAMPASSRLSPALGVAAPISFAVGLFLFTQNIDAGPGFHGETARAFNEIQKTRSEFGGAQRAEELRRRLEAEHRTAGDARESARLAGLVLLGLAVVTYIAHMRVSRPKLTPEEAASPTSTSRAHPQKTMPE